MVEDNGPGIVESQIARIFGKLLYGSKFHKLSQSRGQQGMGISAAGMYGQLTVGKPLHIISRIDDDELASELYVSIDTANNRPDIHKKRRVEWDRPHGTRVEMEIEGHHQQGPHSIAVYLKQMAIANLHVSIKYQRPQGQELRFVRCTDRLPPRPKAIKPHPHGIELGRLIQMLSNTTSRSLLRFLVDEFPCVVESRMGPVAWAIWHRPVSHPRSSNWTCGFPASSFPTGFTVRPTMSRLLHAAHAQLNQTNWRTYGLHQPKGALPIAPMAILVQRHDHAD